MKNIIGIISLFWSVYALGFSASSSRLADLHSDYEALKMTSSPNELYDIIYRIISNYETSVTEDGSCVTDSASQILFLTTGHLVNPTDFKWMHKDHYSFVEYLEDIVGIDNFIIGLKQADFVYELQANMADNQLAYVGIDWDYKKDHSRGHQFLVVKLGGELWVIHNQDWVYENGPLQKLSEFLLEVDQETYNNRQDYDYAIISTPICHFDHCAEGRY